MKFIVFLHIYKYVDTMKKLIIISIFLAGIYLGSVGQEINWMTFEEAIEKNNESPKKLMVDVYTDWCSWCKVMDENTFSHPVIASYVNNNFYAVKFDAEQESAVKFNGQVFNYVSQGKRGYHELAAVLLNGKLSFPSVVFLDEDINIIYPLQGYVKPKPFDEIINFIGDDAYKSKSWEDFQASYNSPLAN